MDDVKAWLNGARHYRVGVMLYLKYGSNLLLKKSLVQEAESKYKKDTLVKMLQSMVQEEPKGISAPAKKGKTENKDITNEPEVKQDPIIPDVSAETPSTDFVPKTWPRSDCKDDYEVKLWEKAMKLLKEIANLHANLSSSFSDYERRTIAFELLRKDDELDELYIQRDYYRQHKAIKEQEEIEYVTDPFMMAKRLANLLRYIRREKGNLKTKGDTTERKQRLETYVKEYNHYATLMQKPLQSC